MKPFPCPLRPPGQAATGAAVLLGLHRRRRRLGIRASTRPTRARRACTQLGRAARRLGAARAKLNENRAFTNNHILESAAAGRPRTKKIEANNEIDRQEPRRGRGNDRDDEGRAEFAALEGDAGLPRGADRGARALRRGRRRRRVRAQQGDRRPGRDRAPSRSSTTLFDAKVALANDRADEIEAAARRADARDRRCSVVALLVGFAIAFWFARRHPARPSGNPRPPRDAARAVRADLRNALSAVAKGDLTVDVTPVTPRARSGPPTTRSATSPRPSARSATTPSPPSRPTTRCAPQLAGTIGRARRQRRHRRRGLAADGGDVRRDRPRGRRDRRRGRPRSRRAPSARCAASSPPARPSRGPRRRRSTSAEDARETAKAAGRRARVALEGVDAANRRPRRCARSPRLGRVGDAIRELDGTLRAHRRHRRTRSPASPSRRTCSR